MANPFKGVPISSRSQAGDIPVEVVSQASYKDIEAKLDASYTQKADTSEDTQDVPKRVDADFGLAEEAKTEETKVSTKAEAVRTGQLKVSELTPIDFDDFMHSSIVALPKRMPTMLDVRAKDPAYRLRWVNFKADGGRRVDECKAMGFSIATRDEVIGLESGSIMVQPDGIKYHDVILMKVPTYLMFGWLKQNAMDSSSKVSPRRLHQAAKNEGQKSVRHGIMSEGMDYNQMKDMIQVYVPGENEVPNK